MFIDTSTAFFMEINCLHLNEYWYWIFALFIFLAIITGKKKQLTEENSAEKIQTESEYFVSPYEHVYFLMILSNYILILYTLFLSSSEITALPLHPLCICS